jgi:DNA-binding NarL/FixJ family response regulator
MSNEEYNPLSSISWQLKRIADALEEMNEMNRPKDNESIDVIDKLRKRTTANEKPRAWTESEQKQLRDLLDEDTPIKEIAKVLDRSEGAIRSRIRNHMYSPQKTSLIRQMLKTAPMSSFDNQDM